MTTPDNVFIDPIAAVYIGKNTGVAPYIEVLQDAKALSEGPDPSWNGRWRRRSKCWRNSRTPEVVNPPYPVRTWVSGELQPLADIFCSGHPGPLFLNPLVTKRSG